MRHRLLHTLVFSSAALVGGCGAANQAVVAQASGGGSDDVRYCEPGWPTTKGQFRYPAEGVTYGCSIQDGYEMDPEQGNWRPTDASTCCVVRPEEAR